MLDAPYFRIFDSVAQGERFDPTPIVDHATIRARALDTFAPIQVGYAAGD